jgi:hypothetical protein
MSVCGTRVGDRLVLHQPSTIGNSLAIRHAANYAVTRGRKVKGDFFEIASAYVDRKGFGD